MCAVLVQITETVTYTYALCDCGLIIDDFPPFDRSLPVGARKYVKTYESIGPYSPFSEKMDRAPVAEQFQCKH